MTKASWPSFVEKHMHLSEEKKVTWQVPYCFKVVSISELIWIKVMSPQLASSQCFVWTMPCCTFPMCCDQISWWQSPCKIIIQRSDDDLWVLCTYWTSFLLTIFSIMLARPVPCLDLCKNLAFASVWSSQHPPWARHYSGYWGYGGRQDREFLISGSLQHFCAPINSCIYSYFWCFGLISSPLVYLSMNSIKCIPKWHIPFCFFGLLFLTWGLT